MSETMTKMESDLTEALKSRDALRTSTLRSMIAEVRREEKSGKTARTMGEDEVKKLLVREVKKRRESAGIFAGAGRPELADRELGEVEVISAYLPAALTDDELVTEVTGAITRTGADSVKAMGLVMKDLNARLAGRVDGRALSNEVRRQLGA